MLELKNVSKTYKGKRGAETKALVDVSLKFENTGLVFILGKSGCGKSTLMNVMGGLDKADSGEIVIMGKSSRDFSATDFDSYRNTFVGFVFQEFNILNEFSVEDNIAVALELQGKKRNPENIEAILKKFELEGFSKRKPNTLSGGQKQRVALARALVKDPKIILADEPTGSLDSETGKEVLDTLKKLSEQKLVIIVSHDRDFAEEYADRIVEMKDGKIVSDRYTGRKEIATESERTYLDGDRKLIRSRLPLRHALRLGASGLKVKPVRLIFTVLLTMIAFVVFGAFSTLALYNERKITANTLKDENIEFLNYAKSYEYEEKLIYFDAETGEIKFQDGITMISSTEMTKEEYESLLKKYPGAIGTLNQSFVVNGLELNNEFYPYYFAGIAFSEDNGASLRLIQGRMPENASEAAIPDFMMRAIMAGKLTDSEGNIIEIKDYSDFDKIPPQSYRNICDLTIVGVYAAEPVGSRYTAAMEEAEKNGIVSNRSWDNELSGGFYNYLFVHQDFVDRYVGTLQGEQYISGSVLGGETYFDNLSGYIELNCENLTSRSISHIQKYGSSNNLRHNPLRLYDLTGTNRVNSLRDNEIAVASSKYADLMRNYLEWLRSDGKLGANYDANTFNLLKTQLDNIYRNPYDSINVSMAISTFALLNGFMEDNSIPAPEFSVTNYLTGESTPVSLAAIYYAKDNYGTAYFADNLYAPYASDIISQKRFLTETRYVFNPDAQIGNVFLPKSVYSGKLTELIDSTYESAADSSSFSINNGIMDSVFAVNSTVSLLKKISLGLWLGFTAFAILLMFAFISASISAKKKDIGILRAIGARSADVFMIFWAEALMVALTCLILSIAVTAIICPVLNRELLETDLINIPVMDFGWLNALMMAAVSVVTATIATIIPVLIYSKKPPVDSIRAL